VNILIYARTVWQAVEWLRECTGIELQVFNALDYTAEVGQIKAWVALPSDDLEKFEGTEFELVVKLISPPSFTHRDRLAAFTDRRRFRIVT